MKSDGGRVNSQKLRCKSKAKATKEMLRASRIVRASKRGFATVVDAPSGFKVAAVDNAQPSSSVTVLLKAGSRYQSKPGVAHALSNFAFKVRFLFYFNSCATRGSVVHPNTRLVTRWQ